MSGSVGSRAGERRYFWSNVIVFVSVKIDRQGEAGGGLEEMMVGPGGTGSEGRSVGLGDSLGREANAGRYQKPTLGN